ncbi:MAG: type II toxin-antitoxin system HicA family toxin [Bacteroidales bacterium]
MQNIGFIIIRINGSHHRIKHPDGRVTTVPVHKNQDLPKGLLRKIIREDLELDLNCFLNSGISTNKCTVIRASSDPERPEKENV